MTIGELRVGVQADSSIFTSNDVVVSGDSLILPDVTYVDSLATSVSNVGTINVTKNAHLSASLTNGVGAIFNVTNKLVVTDEVHNQGTITASGADFKKAFENLGHGSKLNVSGDITMASLLNQGEVSGNTLSATAQVDNQGSIVLQGNLKADTLTNQENATLQAQAVDLDGNMTNNGAVDVSSVKAKEIVNQGSAQLTASGDIDVGKLTNETGASVSGSHFLISGDVKNNGTLTQTAQVGSSNFHSMTNSGTVNLAHETRMGTLTNNLNGTIGGNVALHVSTGLTNAGTLGQKTSRLASLTVEETAVNTGSIYVKAADVTGLDNQVTGTLDVEGKLSLNGNVTNAGTLTAGQIIATGEVVNTSSITTGNDGASSFGAVDNSGMMTFGSDAEMTSLNNSSESAKIEGGINLTVNGGLKNAGQIGRADTRLTQLLSDGETSNSGKIYAERATFNSTFTNEANAVLDVTDDFSLADATNNGTMRGATVDVRQSLSNFGTLNATEVNGVNATIGNNGQMTVMSGFNVKSLNNGINGQLQADHADIETLTNDGRVTLSGTQGSSTIAKLDNTSGGAVFNASGTVHVTGNLDNKGVIDQNKTMTLTVDGVADNQKTLNALSASFGQLKNFGKVDVLNTLTTTTAFANSGTVTAKDVNVGQGTNNGALTASGTMTVANGEFSHQGGTLSVNALKLNQGGFVVGSNGGIATIGSLESTGGSTFDNARDLTLGHIGTTSGLTYNQTAGTLTVTDNTFFSNSTLNISGGKLERFTEGSNTFGQGNTIRLSGSNTDKLPSGEDGKLEGDWRNGYTYAHVGVLDSGSTVTVEKGAILEADDVNLTANSLTIDGGVLASDMGSFFVSVTEDFFTIDTGEANKLPTMVLGTKDVGALEESFGQHVQIGESGGTLVLTDEYVYLDAVASANKKLSEVFSGKDMSVVFTGNIADPTTRDNNFYHQTFADLKAEQKPDSKFNTPGLVFSNMAYLNKENANGVAKDKLVIGSTGTSVGDDAYLLDLNIGFMNVGEASEVVVQDGKTFALTGNKNGIELVGDAQGKVTVTGAKSVFNLGNQGVAGVKGYLGTLSVENDGAFKAVKGEYSLDKLQLLDGTGEVMADAVLTVASLSDVQGATELTNRGELTITEATTFNGVLTNEGKLNMVGVNGTLSGKFVNANGALASFDQLTIGTSDFSNTDGSKVVAERGWNLLQGSQVSSDGRLVSYGTNTIDGVLTLNASGHIVAQGESTVNGKVLMHGGGLFTQMNVHGVVGVLDGGVLVVEDSLSVVSGGTLSTDGKATIVAVELDSVGFTQFDSGTDLLIGYRAFNEYDKNAIKGDDYRPQHAMFSQNSKLKVESFTEEREYDISPSTSLSMAPKQDDFEGYGKWGSGKADQKFRIGQLHLKGNGSLDLDSDWYVLKDDKLEMNASTTIKAHDYVNEYVNYQTNFIVKGSVIANGSGDYHNLVMADNGSYALGATGRDKGKLLTLFGGKYTVSVGGTAEFDSLLTTHDEVVESTGKLVNAGTLTLGGGTLGKGASIENAGTFNITDTLNVAGSLTATEGSISGKALVVAEGGTVSLANTKIDNLKTIRNEGSLTVDDAKRFGAGNTYVHSGNATLATNGTWFEGTNLEFTDGAIFNVNSVNRKTLGDNKVVISGGTPASIQNGEPNTGTFDGMTKVTVHTLEKSGEILVKEGGYLDVEALSGEANVTVENGGVLGLAITDLTKYYLDGSTIDKDENVEIDSDKFGVAHFVGDKLNGITFNDANVELKTTKDTETLATIMTVADGLSGLGSVTAVFNGKIEGAASNNTFTIGGIAELFDEQSGNDSPVINPGVVLTGYSLDAANASEIFFSKEQGRQNAVAGSIGFRSIKNADKVTVESGLTTSLTGYEGVLNWSDDQRLLVASSAGKGGEIYVTDGRVIFGNGATNQRNAGWVDSLTVTADGLVEVKHFNLGVKHAALSGKTTISTNASMTANSLEFGKGAMLTSAGILTVGTDSSDEVLNVLGGLESTGTLDLSKIETINIGATDVANASRADGTQQIVNRGQATYGNVVVQAGGRLENHGTESGNDLTIVAGATHQTSNTSTWNNVSNNAGAKDVWGTDAENETVKVTINDGGKYVNEGILDATKSEAAEFKGVLETSNTASFNALAFNGTLAVKDGTLSAAQFTVQSGSTLSIDKGVMALNGMSVEEARSATQKDAVLGLGGSLNLEGSSLVVGTKDQDAAVAAGDVYFGTDSALVIDTSRLSADHMIKGNGNLVVKTGSELVVTNASWGKHILITDGLDTSGVEEGAWDGDYFVNKTNIYMDYVFKDGKLVLQVGKPGDTAIGSLSKDFVAPNVINGLIDTEEGAAIRDVNSPFADVAFIDRMLDVNFAGKDAEGNLNLANSLEKMNSVIGFNAATGMDAYAHTMVSDKMDRIDRRAQSMLGLEDRSFWVDVIGSKTKMDGLGFGNGEAGFNADNYGLIFGADVDVRNGLRGGAAFNYVDGDVESEGDVVSTKTDAETLGLTLYGAYEWGDFRLLGQLGYDRVKGDAKQNFADVQANSYEVTGNTEAQIFSLGLAGEYLVDFGSFSMVPHAGLRLTHADYDAFDSYINGKKAFHNEADASDIVQLPIGVAFKGNILTNGWMLMPTADVSVVPQFGDTDSQVRVSATNFAGTDTYGYDIAGDFVGKLNLGLTGEKDAHRFGVSLDFSAGDKGARSTGVTFDYRLTF